MMKGLFGILLILSAWFVFGQQAEQYETDTIIRLRKQVYKYHFDFDGGKQGFYWGQNDQLGLRPSFMFFVKNSSCDKIVIEKISEGNSVVTFKPFGKLPEVLQPQDTLKIIASVQTNEEHIDVPIHVFYKRNGIRDTLIIPTWQNKLRTHLLRIYQHSQDISAQCKVYAENNGIWEPLRVNDSIPGYLFFIVRAEQDALVKVRIEGGRSKMTETTIFTSRGSNGYLYYELEQSLNNYSPSSFYWKPINFSPNQYCLFTRKWNYYDISTEYMDSLLKMVKKSAVQSLHKENMILTISNPANALNLDQQLRKSRLEAKLLPVVNSTQLLDDKFTIFFIPNTSTDQIVELFQQAGIATYFLIVPTESEKEAYGNVQGYVFRVNSVIGSKYQKSLMILWNSPLVKSLMQNTFRNPYLPDELD
ncbi:hypothetical protein [Fluviicola taffensis]|uniref:Uncharacterized protein n=1 Tax=Fluviicola taffensis (strain DSM 16823 / NCIMB 13979 / RW262) TaxID=755732 RepID=F2IF15_FLUTR|nr:hypothetical protein [Fluviicola taffensis]AEA42480.1 hypothetical protein Fluta_0475 [Fluviicola taffensis DSM 16823]